MKFRSDHVTNSSSSSFILAVKSFELNDKQKEALLKVVAKLILNGDTMGREDVEKWYNGQDKDLALEAIDEGKQVIEAWVNFEEPEWDLADIYKQLISAVADNSDGNIDIINDDLSY